MFDDEGQRQGKIPDPETVRNIFFMLIRAMAEERDAHSILAAKDRYSWEMGAVWMLRFLTGAYPGTEWFKAKLKNTPSVYPDQVQDISPIIDESFQNTVLNDVLRPTDHDDSLQAEICKHCIYCAKGRPDGSPLRQNHVWCKKQKCEIEAHLQCKVGRWGYFV